jgi:hypothetical protein
VYRPILRLLARRHALVLVSAGRASAVFAVALHGDSSEVAIVLASR